MAKKTVNQDFAIRRVFLRVPINSKARVFVEQEFSREVQLNDISSGGLSFFTTSQPSLPDYFNIEFHLESAGKPVKATLAVKSRIPAGEKLRLGCNFFEINDADKNHITQYICKFTNLTKPLKALAMATLLCFIDAMWRIPAYFLYCRAVAFEKLSQVGLPYRFYFVMLLLYAACALYGHILSGRPAEKLGRSRFLLSALCLFVGCIFVVTKASTYLSFTMVNSLPFFLDIFIWIYLIFAVYVGYAEISVLLWARRIDSTSQILERHSTYAPK